MSPKKIYDIYPPRGRREKKETVKHKIVLPKVLKKKPVFKWPVLKIKMPAVISSQKGLLFLAGVLVAVIVFFHFSSRARIEVWPKTEEVSFERELLIDSQILVSDFSKGVVAGRLFYEESEKTETFATTGRAEKGTKASGEITVYNNYHLDQVLVASTRFISADGKLFYSTEKITVPAKNSRQVLAEAAEVGPEYNIKPSTFSIPGLLGSPRYTSVYGKSLTNMVGGFTGEVAQVSEQDLKQAKVSLLSQMQPALSEKLNQAAGPSFWLAPEAIQIRVLTESSSKKQGEATEKFDFNLKIRAQAVAPSKSELEEFGQGIVLAGIGPEQRLKQGSLELAMVVKENDDEAGSLLIKLLIKAKVVTKIETEDLKIALTGKNLKEAQALLQEEERIADFKIKLSPFWQNEIPGQSERIEIRLTY